MVKESDSKSDGLCPRGFESPRCRSSFVARRPRAVSSVLGRYVPEPNIAQLVERSTVDLAVIEWSLVRFRVFGHIFRNNCIDARQRFELFRDLRSSIGLVVMTSA